MFNSIMLEGSGTLLLLTGANIINERIAFICQWNCYLIKKVIVIDVDK